MPKRAISEVYNSDGKRICGAYSRRTGQPCQRPPMANGRCNQHGGKTPMGRASSNFKHGRYSKYMPAGMRERYFESINEPSVLELIDEIGIIDSRIADRLTALEEKTDVSSSTWRTVRTLWRTFMGHIRSGNQEGQQELLRQLNEVITSGSQQADVWDDLLNLVESRRKLVDSEGRRMEVKANIVTVEQAFYLVSATIDALKEVVYRYADPETARHIIVDASAAYKKNIGHQQITG